MSVQAVKRTGLYKDTWLVMFYEYLGTGKKHIYVKMCKNCGTFIYTRNKLHNTRDTEIIESELNAVMIRENVNGYCKPCYKIAREYNEQPQSYMTGYPIG